MTELELTRSAGDRRPYVLGTLDPALVLFAAFVVRSLAEDAGSAAAAGASTAATG